MSSSPLLLDAGTLSVTRVATVLAMLAAEDPDAQKTFDQTDSEAIGAVRAELDSIPAPTASTLEVAK